MPLRSVQSPTFRATPDELRLNVIEMSVASETSVESPAKDMASSLHKSQATCRDGAAQLSAEACTRHG